MVLTNRPVVANRPRKMTPGIGAQAAVVIDLVQGGSRGSAIERVAATLTNEHPLQQGRYDCAPERMTSVLFQLLLRPSKSRFADQSRHRDLDPFLPGPFMFRTVGAHRPRPLPRPPRDSLARTGLGLPKARPALVCRVAQHAPDRGSLPTCRPGPGWNLALVQQARNRTDAETLHRVGVIHQADDSGLRFDDFVAGPRAVTLPHVAIAVRSAAEHIDRSLLGAMAFPAPRALGDLGAFIFGDHPLELYQQLVFRSARRGGLQEDRFDTAAGQLLDQQHLIGILAGQAVRTVDESRFDLTGGRQIAQSLQPRPLPNGTRVAVIQEAPLGRNQIVVSLSILGQGHQLALDGVGLLLAVGRHTGVNRGWLRHSDPPPFHGVASQPAECAGTPRVPVRHKLEPISPPPNDQIDTPAAAFVPDLTAGQPRPPPRCRTASNARLTISLKVNPVDLAYARSLATKRRESLTVKETLASW